MGIVGSALGGGASGRTDNKPGDGILGAHSAAGPLASPMTTAPVLNSNASPNVFVSPLEEVPLGGGLLGYSSTNGVASNFGTNNMGTNMIGGNFGTNNMGPGT